MPKSKESETSRVEEPLALREKVCFGLGDVSHGLAISSTGVWMLNYLTDVAGLRPLHAGLALLIGRIWDAVTDPLMGWITDNTRSRFGKRRPYLLFGAIPYMLAFFALWVVPDFGGDGVLVFAYVVVTLLIFNTCFTMVFVPYTTLTASITRDYNERTALTGFRMFSSQSAFLIGASVPPILVLMVAGVSDKEASRLDEAKLWIINSANSFFQSSGINALFGAWGGTERQAYFMMALVFGIIMVLSILTTFFGTRERYSDHTEARPKDQTPFSYAESILTELRGNRPFRISALILLITNCASTLVAVNLPYYLEYVVDMKPLQGKIFFFLFFSAILAMPIWVWVSKRFGKAETYRGAMTVYVFVLCCLAFLEPRQESFAIGIAMVAGFFNAASLMLPWAIIPDVIEYDELKCGKRREGLFYGGTTFCYKAATGIAIFIQGSILDFAGFVANSVQTPEVMLTIRMLIGPAPAILIIIAAILSKRYPLTRERHQKILEELKAKV